MRKEFRQRLAKEYRYAATKMQEVSDPAKKLFYFTVLFSEAQRELNWEWDRDLVLIFTVAQYSHTQINASMQIPALGVLSIDWTTVFDKLTQVASLFAAYYEKPEKDDTKQEMYQALETLAEIAYAVTGNGSYLQERGVFKL